MKKRRWNKKKLLIVVVVFISIYIGAALKYNADLRHKNYLAEQARQEQQKHGVANDIQTQVSQPIDSTHEITPENLLKFTNERRVAAGLVPLTLNSKLNTSAQAKAEDMAARNYWAHMTPENKGPWVLITNAGYSYNKAGENLACGFQPNSEGVVTGWYNSPTHKENMLKPEYTEVGFGFVNAPKYKCGNIPEKEQLIVVQHLAEPYGI